MCKNPRKRIKPKEAVINRIEASLDHSKIARYPFENKITRSFYLASGRSTFRLESVLQSNYLPSYVICGVIDS